MGTYEQVRAAFEWERPTHCNFATDVIDVWARDAPDKVALVWTDDSGTVINRTFAEISNASRRVANVLSVHGVKRGDTVLIILSRQIAWWEVLTATQRMGAVASPGTTQLSTKDIAYRVQAAGATCIVTDDANADKVDAIADDLPAGFVKVLIDGSRTGWVDYERAVADASDGFADVSTAADDIALCYFTSGTTGNPKMAVHGHGYGFGHVTTGKYWLDLGPDDLHWNISDTGWAKAAWSSYYGPWLQGAALFVHHTNGFDPARTLQMFDAFPITTMCSAPTIYRIFVQQDLSQYAFPHLRHCVAAGEPLNPQVIAVWKAATGLTPRDGYGQTETTILCANMLDMPTRAGSMGKPAPGIDLDVIDDNAQPVPPNTEGDIAVKVKPQPPRGLFQGYKNDPAKTAETFRGDYYLTGDRAYKDEDGYFWFVSRADDVIISAGYRIGPFEVESALLEHDAVMESAVVASPDETRGDVVKAYVVLADGFQPSDTLTKDIQDFVKSATAPYKYPRLIKYVDTLPKTVSGKIRRVELRGEG
ncbi:AMP-binding protein [Sulfitobacter sp. JB4-11]|uniref:AMP-binding protein n=1 Tax=Sulfitobacter rhodophyticola TaxID=3238304 RepID=UPI00351787C5